MNINDIKTTHKLSVGKQVKTKKDLTYSKNPETACVIPAGTALTIHFSEVNYGRVYFDYNGHLRSLNLSFAFDNITGINKRPSLRTLEKWSMDGVAKTVTGERTEPDGTVNGAPSWLLALGVI